MPPNSFLKPKTKKKAGSKTMEVDSILSLPANYNKSVKTVKKLIYRTENDSCGALIQTTSLLASQPISKAE